MIDNHMFHEDVKPPSLIMMGHTSGHWKALEICFGTSNHSFERWKFSSVQWHPHFPDLMWRCPKIDVPPTHHPF